MKILITAQYDLPEIPSASGIEYSDGKYFVIGDNSAWLFTLNDKFEIIGKQLIYENSLSNSDTIAKSQKPDFEAITKINPFSNTRFYIFGSGAKSPQRDILLEIDTSYPDSAKQHSLVNFYNQLRIDSGLELNIEGAATTGQNIYLLNRSDNCLIKFSAIDFEKYLSDHNHSIAVSIYRFRLPQQQSVQISFSGACFLPGTTQLIFTATAENTSNAIDDGEIMGSFLGVIDLENLSSDQALNITPVIFPDKTDQHKIESLVVTGFSKKKANLVLVSDQDGGVSKLYTAELTF